MVATPTDLFALRYPDTNDLYVLACDPCPVSRELEAASSRGALHVSSPEAAGHPAVVIASERMDDSPAWRLLEPGELLRIGRDLRIESSVALPDPPARMLALSGTAAATQDA